MQPMTHGTMNTTHVVASATPAALAAPVDRPIPLIDELERIRAATLELRLMQEEYHAMRPAPRSPRLDGMPRGGGVSGDRAGDGMARLIDAREMLASRIRTSGEALAAMLERARPRLDALPAHLFAFCLHYYVNAAPIAEVALIMQRDRKTVYEYKKKLAAYA